MQYRIQVAFVELAVSLLIGIAPAMLATPAVAADKPADNFCHNGFAPDGSCRKTEPDDIKASHIITEYCDIVPYRVIRGTVIDPSLTDKQAVKYRADTFNDAEKKLLALRQKLMKLNQPDVEEILHSQMEPENPDNSENLMCVLEIVARLYPKEFDAYAKMIKPGVDQTGFVDFVRNTYLGKSAALHEDPDKT